MEQTLNKMRKHGFTVAELDTAEQAKQYLLDHIPEGAAVGVSGSVSVRDTGVLPALLARGNTVFSHWDVAPEEVTATRRKANAADVYLTSANAMTKQGELILIDGAGNRVAAVAYGPKQLYFVVSRDKMVNGGYAAAVARTKKDACPPNARRQNKHTPCADTGACNPEACDEDCMCRITLLVDRVPRDREFTVLFVGEKLGY